MREVQSTYLLSFLAALETLSTDIEPADRDIAYTVLREELSLSGRDQILAMLDRFWTDLSEYETRPDGSPERLLDRALRGSAVCAASGRNVHIRAIPPPRPCHAGLKTLTPIRTDGGLV